ncbi:MAG: RagB/SusD family nutrient uptake outer membrane protein [Gemmatimonadaceae bacterium]
MRHSLLTGLTAGVLLASLAACSTDRLTVPNYQSPTQASALADPAAVLPLLATGVLAGDRGNLPGFINGVGELGRESYDFFPTDNRFITGWLTASVNTGTSFGGGALWAGYYTVRRNAFQMRNTVTGAPTGAFTAAQQDAALGFADTFDALEMLYVIDARDSVGAPVGMTADPTVLQPFVSRDSVYGYIIGQFNQAITELGQGGSSFPFALHSGFTGFDTPATFAQFTAGLLARTLAYRASLGVDGCTKYSATCYQQVLTALGQSFISTSATLSTGVYQIYSQAAGDATNGISNAFSYIVAWAHVDTGVATQPGGALDNRFLTKIQAIPPLGPSNPTVGIKTSWEYVIYPTLSSSIPVIRNEELILLRAEAEYFTGDQAGALNDINLIRTESGLLAPRGAFTSDNDFITELLYNRRLSLAFEGHRWIDYRRFGLLNELPIDSNDPSADPNMTPYIVIDHLPIPQAECLIRAGVTSDLAVPASGNCGSA